MNRAPRILRATLVLWLVLTLPALSACDRRPRLEDASERMGSEKTDAYIYRGRPIQVLDIEKNEYDPDAFSWQDGFLSYDDGRLEAIPGIDVSTFQDKIDWQAVADSGVKFAFLRAGYRGYTAGQIYQDDFLVYNLGHALDAGIEVGIYFFSQAVTPEEAMEEADYLLRWIEGWDVTYPIVFDWEPFYNDQSRTNEFDGAMLTDCALAFCQKISEAGYRPAVYFYRDLAYLHYDLTYFEGIDTWLAEYNETPTYLYDFEILQYSNTGRVPGIDGEVDLNLSFVDYGKAD